MQTTRRCFLGYLLLGLTFVAIAVSPTRVSAQGGGMATGEQPLILLGPYQIVLKSHSFVPSLDAAQTGGAGPINAPDGKQFLVLNLEFVNSGKDTFKEIQLTVNYTTDDGTPLAMAPYDKQPKDTIKGKAPAPGKSISGQLVYELPFQVNKTSLTAVGVKADGSLTKQVTAPLATSEE